MNAPAVADSALKEIHVLRLATYRLKKGEPAPITIPTETVDGVELQVSRQPPGKDNEYEIETCQGYFRDPAPPVDAARQARELVDRLPRSRGDLCGATYLVVARSQLPSGEREPEARALLAELIDRPKAAVVGGLIGRGVELWAPRDHVGWLVVLCDDSDDGEADAMARVRGDLTLAESAFHKVTHQAKQAAADRDRLRRTRRAVEFGTGRLTELLDQPHDDSADADLEVHFRQHATTTRVLLLLVKRMGRMRGMANSIAINRQNFRVFSARLGRGPGRRAMGPRRDRLDQELAQVRFDLHACRPALEAARSAQSLHQARAMTTLTLAERKANDLRAADGQRAAGLGFLLTMIGVWIGLAQIGGGLLALDKAPLWVTQTGLALMFAPAVCGALALGFVKVVHPRWKALK